MTLKRFKRWCAEKEAEGLWRPEEADRCKEILALFKEVPWWKRRTVWGVFEILVLVHVVIPIEELIFEAKFPQKDQQGAEMTEDVTTEDGAM